MIILLSAIPAAFLTVYLSACAIDFIVSKLEDANMEEWNVFRHLSKLLHRPSPLQREIMKEEKEIKDLEKQKADMKRLDQLRERKERLFKEVAAEEVKPYTADPLPTLRNEHYRWCVVCDSYFSGNYCDCLDDKEVRAYTPEQTANILDNGVTVEEAIENYNEAMKNLRN